MREIRFRAKNAGTNEWVYGYAVKIAADDEYHIQIEGSCSYYNIRQETLGQYIGLDDKNGKPIFEGDIVQCYDNANDIYFVAVVEFGNPNHEYNWGYQLKHMHGDKPNLDILLWVDMKETGAECAVIGNIYDNPALLEVAE